MQTAPLTTLETRLLAALKRCNQRLLARMHTDSGDDCSAYSEACALIAECEPEPIPVGEAQDSDFGAFGAAL